MNILRKASCPRLLELLVLLVELVLVVELVALVVELTMEGLPELLA
jgi:hypothetical protein